METAKLNAVDPNAWLADTLARIPDYKINKHDDLLPWHWNRQPATGANAARAASSFRPFFFDAFRNREGENRCDSWGLRASRLR
ncbi:transposase domain-containing protein [Paracoccus alcaliphilus]|uniref:transposase domain-containing protein n=1 Tax=Paracoccus alcaliphilus TaxID=34002 RepID=UPI003B847426